MKIGLFGGTFDPVHIGHLILAQECWFKLDLDKVIFIPAFISPHKVASDFIQVSDRLNMLRLALNGDTRFEISTYEIDKGDISFTVDTVKYFVETHGSDNDFFFIAGADSAQDLPGWKAPDSILEYVKFVTVPRPGFKPATEYAEHIISVDMPDIDISSTEIRKRVSSKGPIDYMVPSKVVEYIRNKGLYRHKRP